MLSVPIWDLLTRKGKRWRPIFGILLLEALGKSSENYEASACLSELVHSGALVIDDIEDNSLLRRGEECLHLKYGLDVALNAGNTLYFLPSVELFNHKYLDNLKKLRIHEIMMNTYLQAHFGQTVDIYWSKHLTPQNLVSWMNDSFEEKILQMYDYKTAAGAKGLAEVASVIVEVDDKIKQTCIEFARTFAVAFQIIDDVHNFSDSPRWTKTCGEDLSNGKTTYAIVKAIKLMEKKESQRLIEILCSSELRRDKDIIAEGIDLVRNSGALDQCREIARKISVEGNEQFSNIVPSCHPKIMLNMLCAKMLDLAFDS
jgi:geranylgeranyl pyrophosphate synthase